MSALSLTIRGLVCCCLAVTLILSWGDASPISKIEHQAPNKYLETIKYPHGDFADWDADTGALVRDLGGRGWQHQGHADNHQPQSRAWVKYRQNIDRSLLNLILISCYSNQECFCDDATFLKHHSGIISRWPTVYSLYIQRVWVARTVIDSVP